MEGLSHKRKEHPDGVDAQELEFMLYDSGGCGGVWFQKWGYMEILAQKFEIEDKITKTMR